MQNGIDISWEGIAAVIAIISSLYSLFKIGVAKGKQESRISEMERELTALKTRLDKGFEDFSARLTRMEDRMYQSILNSTRLIRKEIRDTARGVDDNEAAE